MQPDDDDNSGIRDSVISGDVHNHHYANPTIEGIMIDPNTGLPQNVIIMEQPSSAPKVVGIFVIIFGAIGVLGSALGLFGSALLSEIDDDLASDYNLYLIAFSLAGLVVSIATIIAGTQINNRQGRGVHLAWAAIVVNFILSIAQQATLPSELADPSGFGQAINLGMNVVCTGVCGLIVAIPLMVTGSGMDDTKLF
jgi:hypothetical protein